MAKYMIRASYTADGTKGLLKEGGSSRRATVQKMVSSLGGKLEAFYYAFGDSDVYAIIDIPDAASAAALSLAINASGSVQLSTIPLLTPEEIDTASKKSVGYLAPGS
jgi:uncharacterized protein with GYD domain